VPTTNNPNNHKQDNNNLKKDNSIDKLDPEKLETESTNVYNQPTTVIMFNKHTREHTKGKVVQPSLLHQKINDQQTYYKLRRLQECFNY
jgi:hypothetical protein